jgi:hypothetical protein
MATRPAYVWTGTDWDDIGDKRLGASVTAINSELSALDTALGSKLDLAGGKILQIVRATDATNRSTTSTTFVDVTGMSVTITPQKSDSAILLLASGIMAGTDDTQYMTFQITDSSNNPIFGGQEHTHRSGVAFPVVTLTIIAYATPATTSSVTYKLRFQTDPAVSLTLLNAVTTGQMYAIEVSA